MGKVALADAQDFGAVTSVKVLECEIIMDDRFDKVIAIKQRSHRSWNNFHAAASKQLGLPYSFGTDKVERTSEFYLNTAIKESGMTAVEIRTEIERRKLLRSCI